MPTISFFARYSRGSRGPTVNRLGNHSPSLVRIQPLQPPVPPDCDESPTGRRGLNAGVVIVGWRLFRKENQGGSTPLTSSRAVVAQWQSTCFVNRRLEVRLLSAALSLADRAKEVVCSTAHFLLVWWLSFQVSFGGSVTRMRHRWCLRASVRPGTNRLRASVVIAGP